MMDLPQLQAQAGGFRNYCGRGVDSDVEQGGQMLFMTAAESPRSSLGAGERLQESQQESQTWRRVVVVLLLPLLPLLLQPVHYCIPGAL